MHQSLHSRESGSAVLIIDPLELRRAGVESLLKPWAESNGTSIVAIAPGATPFDLDAPPFKLFLLVIGALRVDDPETRTWISSLRGWQIDVPLVLLSDREEPDEVVAAFKAGVQGFIPTSIAPSVAIQAFSLIMCGGSFFPVTALLLSVRLTRAEGPAPNDGHTSNEKPTTNKGTHFQATGSVHVGRLTMRQKEVLDYLQLGDSNKSIARHLKMRESTVKVHVRQIMRKLGATNRTQAALSAARLISHAVSVNGPAESIHVDRQELLPLPAGAEGVESSPANGKLKN